MNLLELFAAEKAELIKLPFLFLLFGLFAGRLDGQTAHLFTSPDEVLEMVATKSTTARTADEQAALANRQTFYANIIRFNPKAAANYSGTDNIEQAVSFLPAEIFGGPVGTFKEVPLGQQYVQSVNVSPQFDLVNPAAWAKWRSAKANENLLAASSALNKLNLSELALSAYFNAVAAQKQIVVTDRTLENADSILQIVRQKHGQGIARSQDLNNAEVNKLLVADRLQSLEKSLQQQLENLRLLCDLEPSDSIIIEHSEQLPGIPATVNSNLLVRQSQVQREMARLEIKSSRAANYPTLSIVGNWAWQENSKRTFFDKDARWIPSAYIGWRLSVPIPDAGRLSQSETVETNLRIAELNLEHQARQQTAQNRQLELDFRKAVESHRIALEISRLKMDSYQKNLDLFRQDIYSADNLFVSFNDALTAELNERTAAVTVQFLQAKISLYNSTN